MDSEETVPSLVSTSAKKKSKKSKKRKHGDDGDGEAGATPGDVTRESSKKKKKCLHPDPGNWIMLSCPPGYNLVDQSVVIIISVFMSLNHSI